MVLIFLIRIPLLRLRQILPGKVTDISMLKNMLIMRRIKSENLQVLTMRFMKKHGVGLIQSNGLEVKLQERLLGLMGIHIMFITTILVCLI